MYTSTSIESSRNGFGNLVRLEDTPGDRSGIQTTASGALFPTPDNNLVATFDNANLAATTSLTTTVFESQPYDCVVVKTRSGRELLVGADSPLLVPHSDSGQLIQVRSTEATGRLVPIWMGSPFIHNGFNFELGWWYAVLAADGWVSRGTVGYSKDDGKKRRRFEEIAAAQISSNFTCREYHDDGTAEAKFAASTKIHLNGQELPTLIESVYHPDLSLSGGTLRAALFKMLPRKLLYNGSQECLWGLLSGLLDGDSSLGWNEFRDTPRFYAKLNTSSPYLKDDLVFLLQKLGIRCSVT